MPLILGTNSIKDTGYDVANSVRYADGDSPSMTKASTTVTNDKKFTISAWCKRTTLGGGSGNEFGIFSHISDSNNANKNLQFGFYQDHIYCAFVDGGSVTVNKVSNALYRDLSSWYHVMLAVDSTQGTAANRNRIYVNGTEVTSFSTDTNAGADETFLSTSCNISVGRYTNTGGSHFEFDGYLAEVVYIDGLQLTPSSFGEFDSDSPTIWKPIDVTGLTFGNNGFYLDFEDSSNLGNDANGGTDLTESNLAAIDQCTDTCTNNFAVPNILLQGIDITYTQNNLQIAIGTDGMYGTQSSIGVNAGRWYCELKYIATTSAGNDRVMPGIVGNPNKLATWGVSPSPNHGSGYIGGGNDTTSWGYYKDGNIYNNEGTTSYGDTWTLNDIIGIYLDCEDNKLYFSKNGVVQASGTGVSITDPASTVSGNYFFGFTDTSSYGGTVQVNFGGATCYSISSSVSDDNGYGNFEYSPNITGDGSAKKFYSLNSKNLAEFG
ncbi:spry domain protein [uncultured Mediterranean phage uvMED]|nr:spry domain protein [uncultured Mediterranean phage uvMED]